MHLRPILCAFTFAAFAAGAQAASLAELFERTPAPPTDVAVALAASRDGVLVAPELVAFREALAAERAAAAMLDAGASQAPTASLDIDGSASPQLQRIVQGYNAYIAANSGDKAPKAVIGNRVRWVQKAMGQQQLRITQGLKPCATPCADPAVAEHNQAQLQRRARTLATELEMWTALYADWRSKRGGTIADAQERIAAVGDAATLSPQARSALARYRMAMLDEIELLFSITELAVTRAPIIDRGIDGSEPDSISGATRKTAKASRP